jgi:phosphohistidine phosphatase
MKTIWLIRHAKSSWKDLSLNDFDRPLNSRGKRDAPFMGKRLHSLGFMPDNVFSSPAKRARLTAMEICRSILFPVENIQLEQRIYGAGTSDLLHLINTQEDNTNTVCIFGHNPTLTDFSNYLSSDNISTIPTCGIVEISFETDYWSEISRDLGKLVRFDYPKRHLS